MDPRYLNRRRRLLGLAVVTPLLALAACGDDSTSSSDSADVTSGSTLPPVTSAPPAADGIEHPTGVDDVVLRIAFEGGFLPRELAFQNLPTLLVTGDGRVITQGPMIAIYPGPLLPNMQQRTITEAGIQELLALADEYGLFEEGDYTGPENTIADAPNTVVEINAAGTSIEHVAYALGIDPQLDETEDRARLAAFVAAASDIQSAVADDQLGPDEPFVPTAYRINAFEAGDPSGLEIQPTVLEWPADASVRLADAATCAVLPAEEFGALLTDATQLTWFTDGGVTYQVAAAPLLPGDEC